MSRMHSKRKGSSGSKRPLVDKNPEWVTLSADEIKELVAKMAGEGMTTAKIGLVLRDQHAVPNVRLATGMSMKDICAEKGVKFELPEDLSNLMKRAVQLEEHIKLNPKDLHNLRGQQLLESKIRRLAKYYRREGILPETWAYSLSSATLQVE
ncbi:MAG: 30S ribosomal protein S15 [Thermoplasmata archaeon]|jgi:small subunit ribosomal protein S15|nr:30S ribosomal protein S15 [Thermoplasmata archaeon]